MSKTPTIDEGAYEIPVHYSAIESHIRRLAGRILTIIDSAISEERQNKAIKDLVKGEFSETLYQFQKSASDGKAGHSVQLEI